MIALQERRRLTNHEIRTIAGSRGMARVNDLIRKHGYGLRVRNAGSGTWTVEYCGKQTAGAQPELF